MRNHALSLRPARADRDSAQAIPRLAPQRDEANEKKQHTRDLLTAHARVLCASALLGINFAVSYCLKRVGDARYGTFSAKAMLPFSGRSLHLSDRLGAGE